MVIEGSLMRETFNEYIIGQIIVYRDNKKSQVISRTRFTFEKHSRVTFDLSIDGVPKRKIDVEIFQGKIYDRQNMMNLTIISEQRSLIENV